MVMNSINHLSDCRSAESAAAAVLSNEAADREAGLSSYARLLAGGRAYASAVKVAKIAVRQIGVGIQQAGLKLYGELVERERWYELAAKSSQGRSAK